MQKMIKDTLIQALACSEMIHREIDKLEKENERLQAERTKMSKSQAELIALREFVFETMTNYVEDKLPDELILNE